MILKYVKLCNIRSYLKEKVDFSVGSQLLCGDIGSGKSTVLLAIEFALFGIKRGSFSPASLLRNGENSGSVELKFILDNHDSKKEVIIYRSLKRTNTSIKQDNGYIIIDGHKKEATPVELKSEILDLLGYPKVLLSKSKDLIYRYTVYTPQEEMKHILFSDKEERLNTLRRVFNIDKYKRIRENLNIIIKDLKDKIKGLEGRIYSLPEKTKSYKIIIKEANEITREIKELIPQIKVIKEGVSKKELELKNSEEGFLKFRDLKNNVEHKQKDVLNLDNQKKKLESELFKIKTLAEQTKEKIVKLNIKDISQNQIDEKEKYLDSLSNKINDTKK